MADAPKKLSDSRLAEILIDARVNHPGGIDEEVCRRLEIGEEQCERVRGALDDKFTNADEKEGLFKSGFSKDFVAGISRINARRAILEKSRKLSEKCTARARIRSWSWDGGARCREVFTLKRLRKTGTIDISPVIAALQDDELDIRTAAARILNSVELPPWLAFDGTIPKLLSAYGRTYSHVLKLEDGMRMAMTGVRVSVTWNGRQRRSEYRKECISEGDAAKAACAIGNIGILDRGWVEVLLQVLRERQNAREEDLHCYYETARCAAQSLGKLGADWAASDLIEALDDGSSISDAVYDALKQLGLSAVVFYGVAHFTHRYYHPGVQDQLKRLFASFGRDAIPLLEEIKDSNPDADARSAAAKILDAIFKDVK